MIILLDRAENVQEIKAGLTLTLLSEKSGLTLLYSKVRVSRPGGPVKQQNVYSTGPND